MKTIKLNVEGIIHHLVIIIVAVVVAVSAIGVGVYEYANHNKSHAGGWANLGGINGNTLTYACSSPAPAFFGQATKYVNVLLISKDRSPVWIDGYTAAGQPSGSGGDGGWTTGGWTEYGSTGNYYLQRNLYVLASDHVAIRVVAPINTSGINSNTINIGTGYSWSWQNLPYC